MDDDNVKIFNPRISGVKPQDGTPETDIDPRNPNTRSKHRPAYWTHDDAAVDDCGHLYYFAPTDRAPGPYRTQRRVTAIIDIADDGTLAGVELIDDMPPPPH